MWWNSNRNLDLGVNIISEDQLYKCDYIVGTGICLSSSGVKSTTATVIKATIDLGNANDYYSVKIYGRGKNLFFFGDYWALRVT